MLNRTTLAGLALVFLLPFLVGWTYLIKGVHYPSEGPGFRFFWSDEKSIPCNPIMDPKRGCYSVSTIHPYVILYRYWRDSGGYNEHLANPQLIAAYTILLQEGCVNKEGDLSPDVQQEHCTFLEYQVDYLSKNHKSPHKGLDIWPLPNNGRADGIAQAKIAWMYYKEWRRSCGDDYSTCQNAYVTRALRAARAYDWGWDNGGVAHVYNSLRYWYVHQRVNLSTDYSYILNGHNHALIHLFDLKEEWELWVDKPPPFPDPATPNPFTATDRARFSLRLKRGLFTLRDTSTNPPWPRVGDFHHESNRSYYRTSSNGDVPEQLMGCNAHYHKQNYGTLERLIGRGLDYLGILAHYANKWRNHCQ